MIKESSFQSIQKRFWIYSHIALMLMAICLSFCSPHAALAQEKKFSEKTEEKGFWDWTGSTVKRYVTDGEDTVSVDYGKTSDGVLDKALYHYEVALKDWAKRMMRYANWLFWGLVIISMAWTYGLLILRKADSQEFFTESVMFLAATGSFWWILQNGAELSASLINSMTQIAGEAINKGKGESFFSPTHILDKGLEIYHVLAKDMSVMSFVLDFNQTLMRCLFGYFIMKILALVAFNIIRVYITAWVVCYGGVFILGFGGSKWTEFAVINHFKAVIGIGLQAFGMILVVGIGDSFINKCLEDLSEGVEFLEMATLLLACLMVLYLVQHIPSMIAKSALDAGLGSVENVPLVKFQNAFGIPPFIQEKFGRIKNINGKLNKLRASPIARKISRSVVMNAYVKLPDHAYNHARNLPNNIKNLPSHVREKSQQALSFAKNIKEDFSNYYSNSNFAEKIKLEADKSLGEKIRRKFEK